MPFIATKQGKRKDPVVNVMLNGGRVTLSFRDALFAAASRSGMSVNEFVLIAAADALRGAGSEFSGIFQPGDLIDAEETAKPKLRVRAYIEACAA